MTTTRTASVIVAELREFAGFEDAEQRYISRALDIGLARRDAFRTWAAEEGDGLALRRHYIAYQNLRDLRGHIPNADALTGAEDFFVRLVTMVAFDLGQEQIESFSALRFLYERLLGAEVRPWLPAAFCAAAALPQIRCGRRKILLQSLSEAAATAPGWSLREPRFLPDVADAQAA